jgi:hypothetical protein
MSQVKEYTIIYGYPGDMIKNVNNAIKEGWTPFGGIAAVPDSVYGVGTNRKQLAQAMVKYQQADKLNPNVNPTFNAAAQIYDTM